MSTDAKTVLEWTYEPKDLFEVSCTIDYLGGEISIADGKVLGEFDGHYYDQGQEFRELVNIHVHAVFLAQQVQVHQDFKLSDASMAREHSDGRRDVTVFVEPITIKIKGGRVDIVTRNADGEVVRDTRAERLQKQQEFREKIAELPPNDLALKRMLQSFRNALADRDNLLIHLYEVRETLTSEFDSEANAKTALSVSAADWSRFGRLANNEPIQEGRHRGKHAGLRPANQSEFEWALAFVQRLIEAYVTTKAVGCAK